MKNKHRQLFLSLIASDKTFEKNTVRGELLWVGRCIHCQKKLLFSLLGEPLSEGSLEHILPKTHGGSDHVDNLAIACRRCNNQKGKRHDWKPISDDGLSQMVLTLRQRKQERWR